ncbi:hypothetical protein Btru_042149 [Bulinus truncatus]|nr:hypothetical protein Btru_042149 [Bulinus truncatus]
MQLISVAAIPGDLMESYSSLSVLSDGWLTIHLQYCPRFCIENKLHSHICFDYNQCFPCDCDPVCSIYDTCCPRLVEGFVKKPLRKVFSDLPSSDRFQCDTLFNETHNSYYIIKDCDPKFLYNLNNVSRQIQNIADQCENPNPKIMDNVMPYSDKYYGIIYKNKFCALCNGYSINDNASDNTVINSLVKIASPLSINVSCIHFQNMYKFSSEIEFYRSASHKMEHSCETTLIIPKTYYSPKICSGFSNIKTEVKCTSEDIVNHDLCLNISGRSMTVKGYPNVFCVLCAKDKPKCFDPYPLYAIDYDFVSPASGLFAPILTIVYTSVSSKSSERVRW